MKHVVFYLSLLIGVVCILPVRATQASIINYKIDPTRTTVVIRVQQLGFAAQSIHFSGIQGMVGLDHQDAKNSSVEVQVPVKNVNTQLAVLDQKLQQRHWFNTAKYPYISFKSTQVLSQDNKTYKILGNLTIKGVSKPVQLNAVLYKQTRHPFLKVPLVAFTAQAQIKRSDFGLTAYSSTIADSMIIQIRAEALATP